MANPEHVEILKQGVAVWNRWRKSYPSVPDLTKSDLSGANLQNADSHEADLYAANFMNADLP